MAPDRELPDWLKLLLWRALLGEIYPSIRAIAVELREDTTLLLRYYLDRPPVDADRESIDVLAFNISAMLAHEQVKRIDVECLHGLGPIGKLDLLGGLAYARREHEMDDFLVGSKSAEGHTSAG